MDKRKVIFIINTLGRGGAETAFIEFLKLFDPEYWEAYLYVIMAQGELIDRIPGHVTLLNTSYDPSDVFSEKGRRQLLRYTVKRLFNRGAIFRNLPYIIKIFLNNGLKMRHHPEKLLWQALADGTPEMQGRYDLAIAFIEGAATYYLAGKVNADKKAAFIHTDYQLSGYTREMDRDAYAKIDRIFCVSDSVRNAFLKVYPEHAGKTEVFFNILDREGIIKKASLQCSFDEDGYTGIRIVTLGRLVKVKAIDRAIRTMRLLKDAHVNARWYVFGEGSERPGLEKEIKELNLEDCFFLPGITDNPFPYLKHADLYVQCSQVEGRSLAVCEAQILGCAVVVSNRSGNTDHVKDNADGVLVEPEPDKMFEKIYYLINNPLARAGLGAKAEEKMKKECKNHDLKRIWNLLGE